MSSCFGCRTALAYLYYDVPKALKSSVEKKHSEAPLKTRRNWVKFYFRRLVLFFPLIQDYLNKIEQKISSSDLSQEICQDLFVYLENAIDSETPDEHIIILIFNFFKSYDDELELVDKNRLKLRYIVGAKARLKHFFLLLFRRDFPDDVSFNEDIHLELLTLKVLGSDVIYDILMDLTSTLSNSMGGMVNSLDVESIDHLHRVCLAYRLLEMMVIQLDPRFFKPVAKLKIKFLTAVLNHYLPQYRNNQRVTGHLIRLTLTLYVPEFIGSYQVARPRDNRHVMSILQRFRPYLDNYNTNWESMLFPSFSGEIALREGRVRLLEVDPEVEDTGSTQKPIVPEYKERGDEWSDIKLLSILAPEVSDIRLSIAKHQQGENTRPKNAQKRREKEKRKARQQAARQKKRESEALKPKSCDEDTNKDCTSLKTAGSSGTELQTNGESLLSTTESTDSTQVHTPASGSSADRPDSKNGHGKQRHGKQRGRNKKGKAKNKAVVPDKNVKGTMDTVLETQTVTDRVDHTESSRQPDKGHSEDRHSLEKAKSERIQPESCSEGRETNEASRQEPAEISNTQPLNDGAVSRSASNHSDPAKQEVIASESAEAKPAGKTRRKNRRRFNKLKGENKKAVITDENLQGQIKASEKSVSDTVKQSKGKPSSSKEVIDDEDRVSNKKDGLAKQDEKKEEKFVVRKFQLDGLPDALQSYASFVLNSARKYPGDIILRGYNAGRLLLNNLYGCDLIFIDRWEFSISDAGFIDRLRGMLSTLKPPFAFSEHSGPLYWDFDLFREEGHHKQRNFLTLLFVRSNGINIEYLNPNEPFDGLNIMSSSHQLRDIGNLMIYSPEITSLDDLDFLRLWRRLEAEQPKLEDEDRRLLEKLGSDRSLPYGDFPAVDEEHRQRLPQRLPENQFVIDQTDNLPDSLVCSKCQQPKYHAIGLPCHRSCCFSCVEQSDKDLTRRFICPASQCDQAHYPEDCTVDSSVNEALRARANPDTCPLKPVPLSDLFKRVAHIANMRRACIGSFPTISILWKTSDLETVIKENQSKRQGHMTHSERFFSEYSTFLKKEMAFAMHKPSSVHALYYMQMVLDTYQLIEQGLQAINRTVEDRQPDINEAVNIAMTCFDTALVHTYAMKNAQILMDVDELPGYFKTLARNPEGLYPSLIDSIYKVYEKRASTGISEEQQYALVQLNTIFTLEQDVDTFISLSGQSDIACMLKAFTRHITMTSPRTLTFLRYCYWRFVSGWLSRQAGVEKLSTFSDEEGFCDSLNQLSGQFEEYLKALQETQFHPKDNHKYGVKQIPQSADSLSALIVKVSSQLQQLISECQGGPFSRSRLNHPFVQDIDRLLTEVTRTKNALYDNEREVKRFAKEWYQSASDQIEIQSDHFKSRHTELNALKDIVKKSKGAEEIPGLWGKIKQLDGMNEIMLLARLSAIHIELLLQKAEAITPPSKALLSPDDLVSMIEELHQLVSKAMKHKPAIYSKQDDIIRASISEATLQDYILPLEGYELIDTYLEWYQQLLSVIQNQLIASMQWLAHRPDLEQYLRSMSALAKLAKNMDTTLASIKDFLNEISMFRAIIDHWYTGLQKKGLPISNTMTRQVKTRIARVQKHLPDGYVLQDVNPDGNCLYTAILTGNRSGSRPPSRKEVQRFRQQLHHLLSNIIKSINSEKNESDRRQLWIELEYVLGTSEEQTNALISEGTIQTMVTGDMDPETAQSYFGQLSVVAPLSILLSGRSIMNIHWANPETMERMIQQRMNVYTTWLHNAPTLLRHLVQTGVVSTSRFNRGRELASALNGLGSGSRRELVESSANERIDVAIVRTGRTDDATDHFMLATYTEPRGEPQNSGLISGISSEQMQEVVLNNPNVLTVLGQLSAFVITSKTAASRQGH